MVHTVHTIWGVNVLPSSLMPVRAFSWVKFRVWWIQFCFKLSLNSMIKYTYYVLCNFLVNLDPIVQIPTFHQPSLKSLNFHPPCSRHDPPSTPPQPHNHPITRLAPHFPLPHSFQFIPQPWRHPDSVHAKPTKKDARTLPGRRTHLIPCIPRYTSQKGKDHKGSWCS